MPASRPRVLLGILGIVGMAITAVRAFVLLTSALGGVVPGLALVLVPFGALALILPSKRALTEPGGRTRARNLVRAGGRPAGLVCGPGAPSTPPRSRRASAGGAGV